MATVTKPIALDESINTTELTPRNIADVLAEELARIAGNILPPNASQIAYDNTGSGLVSTNVQDAIDEVVSSQADVIADTMADLTENKTATVTDGVADFETIDGSLVKSLIVEIEPSQSGSGTPSPDNIRPITGWTQEDVLIVGENLFDGVYPSLTTAINYKPIFVGDGEYTLKTTVPRYNNSGCAVFLMAGRTSSGANNDDHGAYDGHPRTQTAIDGYVTIAYRIIGGINPADYVSTIGKSKTYTTAFGQTVYGGTLDVLTGELTIDTATITFNGSEGWAIQTGSNYYQFQLTIYKARNTSSAICDTFESISISDRGTKSGYIKYSDNLFRFALLSSEGITTVAEWKTWLQSHNVTVTYTLATPTTVHLTPQTVKSLVGENHIQASTGDVLQCKYSMMINGDDLAQLL